VKEGVAKSLYDLTTTRRDKEAGQFWGQKGSRIAMILGGKRKRQRRKGRRDWGSDNGTGHRKKGEEKNSPLS